MAFHSLPSKTKEERCIDSVPLFVFVIEGKLSGTPLLKTNVNSPSRGLKIFGCTEKI